MGRLGDMPFPVLRRFSTGTPTALADLTPELGVHPFAPLVEGQVDKLYGDPGAPIALDPGTDFADWSDLDWRDPNGQTIDVTTVPGRRCVVLRDLGGKALGWCSAKAQEPEGVVDVDPRLIRRVGRGGALIDALLADPTARPEDHQITYDAGDCAAFVTDLVARMGRKPFAAAFDLPLSTIHRLARGARADEVMAARVLDAFASGAIAPTSCEACGALVVRPGATYCSPRCRETAKARRRRGSEGVVLPTCAVSDCIEPARHRSTTCSERHKKALGRLRAASTTTAAPVVPVDSAGPVSA